MRPAAIARTLALLAGMTSTPVRYALVVLLVLVMGTLAITTGGLASEQATIAEPVRVAVEPLP